MNILIVYYSTYGHTFTLAKAIEEGVKEISGVETRLRRVEELVPDEIIEANPDMVYGRDLQRDIPLAQLSDLEWADGIAFGSPTRYGNMTAQMKNYIDQTGLLWAQNKLVGKPATCFTSTATMHGGQETTLVTMWIPLVHLGMVIFGVPYSVSEIQTTECGGTPYGASTVAGPAGNKQPNEIELTVARAQGRRLAEITMKLRGQN